MLRYFDPLGNWFGAVVVKKPILGYAAQGAF
jgi:hypothetical protein